MHHLSPKVLQALEFASIAHKGQLRKFPANVPYISHLAAVALILSSSSYDEDVVVAGVLHDIIEDTPFKAEDIIDNFGNEVYNLVVSVTENKSLPWAERKEKYLRQIREASAEAKAISAADLLANRLSNLMGLRRGENPWIKFSKQPKEYAKRIFDIDQKRLEIIKQDGRVPFLAELVSVMKEVEDLSWQMLENYQPPINS
ncbi:MAG: HD domain-containing protein [Patescibacteria group bacterium]